jgi:hypothetical protein
MTGMECPVGLSEKGASAIKQAQKWLGHSKPTVTMDIYWSSPTGELPDPAIFDYLATHLVPNLVPGGSAVAKAA